jgi:2-keto-4-pentenoate hydratase
MSEVIRPKDLIHLRHHSMRRTFAGSELPQTLEAAYDLAAGTVGLLGTRVAGWKLGATTANTRRIFATEEIYFGALLAEEVWTSTESGPLPSPPVLRGEAEIAFQLATDISPEESEAVLGSPAAEIFDAWAPAIEAPYSCVDNIIELGLRALLMDRCSAGALYLGVPRTDIDDPSIDGLLEIFADGVSVAQGSAKASLLMPPDEAALGFLKLAAAHGVYVRRGQWISTGGISPCVTLPFRTPIRLVLGGQSEFEIQVQGPIE